VAWPKNTASTAAAVAALAEIGSSPVFRQQFPDAAAAYVTRARAGWQFLQGAWARYGRQGAFQGLGEISGFHDLDCVAWAEVEMYLATGDPDIHKQVLADLSPNSPSQMRWSWLRLPAGYGCAIRDYAFGARSGRVPAAALDATLLAACENQIRLAGRDEVANAQASAYNVSYSLVDKRWGNAAWYFCEQQSFKLATAYQLSPSPALIDAIVGNLNYEHGTNPVNVAYTTGMGWRRPRAIVDQYSRNSGLSLPASGIAVGSISAWFYYISTYGTELAAVNYPAVASEPIYDRFTDGWDVYREAMSCNQVQALAVTAWLMARTPLATQAWRCAPATVSLSGSAVVNQPITATLSVPGLDLSTASRIVWEGTNVEPCFGASTFSYTPQAAGSAAIHAEAQWPDGRRAFAICRFAVALPGVGAVQGQTVSVGFASTLRGTVIKVVDGCVWLSSGQICAVPFSLAGFGGLTLSQLVPGKAVTVTVNPFIGTVTDLRNEGALVVFSSSAGMVAVPASVLSSAAQQQITVQLNQADGTSAVLALSQGLKSTTGWLSLVGSPPVPDNASVSVSFRYFMNGLVTSSSASAVGLSCWGVACVVPRGQALFSGAAVTSTGDIVTGQTVSAAATPFVGGVVSTNGVAVTFQSPQGAMTVPVPTVDDVTLQQIKVSARASGTVQVMSLYQARATGATVLGLAP